jgi:hypothetical protein
MSKWSSAGRGMGEDRRELVECCEWMVEEVGEYAIVKVHMHMPVINGKKQRIIRGSKSTLRCAARLPPTTQP